MQRFCHWHCCQKVPPEGSLLCEEHTKLENLIFPTEYLIDSITLRTPDPMPENRRSGSVNVQLNNLIQFAKYWRNEATAWRKESERLKDIIENAEGRILSFRSNNTLPENK
jgi:hypothetical protein